MRYLVVYDGKIRNIIEKNKPLLASDITGYFEQVLVDQSGTFKEGDVFSFPDFVARNDAATLKSTMSQFVDIERYVR